MSDVGRVLVVDDIMQNIQLIGATLNRGGYDVFIAHSGEEALEKAQQTNPDLILLDVMMPGIDGYETCALIKQHREIAKNLTVKLTQLVSGGKAPDMVLIESGKETKTLHNYSGKHVYIQFMDIESLRTEQELPLMKEIHSKYGNYVHFISIYKASELSELDEKQKKLLEKIQRLRKAT